MIKQASLISGLVVAAALAAGPMWPATPVGAQDARAPSNARDDLLLSTNELLLLSAHNGEREKFGSSPLVWNPELAQDAKRWAARLAERNKMQHAGHEERKGAGENLWSGTRGHYDPERMIGAFIAEKKHFKPGEFPKVSTTKRWSDVGHYTQLIWPETREVGCAIAENRTDEFLVCRYLPAGNVRGVLLVKKAETANPDNGAQQTANRNES